MHRTITSVALCISASLLGACASGPTYQQVASTFPAVDQDHGRIFFLRDDKFAGSAVQPEIRLNGIVVGRSKPGGFFYVDELPGQYTVTTATEVEEHISFDLAAGQTRYVRTAVSMGILVGHVAPTLVWPDSALAELQALHYVRNEAQPAATVSNAAPLPAGNQIRRSTYAGKPVLLSSHSVWDRNCQSVSVPQIDVVQHPAHGRLDVKEGDFVISEQSGFKCAGSKVHGALVSYVPEKGFIGVENIRYTSSGSPGVVREAVIEIVSAPQPQ
jgi:hypothetical protein